MSSGRQPAKTALIATFSARTTVFRPAISPSTWSRRSAPPASISAIDFSVGGTTGSPPGQPRAKYASIRLAGAAPPRGGGPADPLEEALEAGRRDKPEHHQLVVGLVDDLVLDVVAEKAR